MKKEIITPDVVTHKQFGQEIQGYKVESVNSFLDEIALHLQENDELILRQTEQIKELEFKLSEKENDLAKYKTMVKRLETDSMNHAQNLLSDMSIIKSISNIEKVVLDLVKKIEKT